MTVAPVTLDRDVASFVSLDVVEPEHRLGLVLLGAATWWASHRLGASPYPFVHVTTLAEIEEATGQPLGPSIEAGESMGIVETVGPHARIVDPSTWPDGPTVMGADLANHRRPPAEPTGALRLGRLGIERRARVRFRTTKAPAA